jgi:c(7)-type cytochrome triheme protein
MSHSYGGGKSMKTFLTTIITVLAIGFYSMVWAVPPGMTVEFTKSPMGKVVFSGQTHADKGLKCDDCHPKIFEQKKGTAQIKMEDHQKGEKYCFACHNGTKAFKADGNCNKCHKPAG